MHKADGPSRHSVAIANARAANGDDDADDVVVVGAPDFAKYTAHLQTSPEVQQAWMVVAGCRDCLEVLAMMLCLKAGGTGIDDGDLIGYAPFVAVWSNPTPTEFAAVMQHATGIALTFGSMADVGHFQWSRTPDMAALWGLPAGPVTLASCGVGISRG